jgi:hypothetical protein
LAGLNEWGIMFIFFGSLLVACGATELIIVYLILKQTTSRLYHLAVPLWILLLGYFLIMYADISIIVSGSLFLIVPMTVLIPLYAVPSLTDPESILGRIVACYEGVSAVAAILVGIFLLSELPFDPVFFLSRSPLFNATIYAAIVILYTFVAFLVYKFLFQVLPVQRLMETKPE